MRSKVILSAILVAVAVFTVLRQPHDHPEQPCSPAHCETPPACLPDGFAMTDVTLYEALDAFYDWYRDACPPMQQSISYVVKDVQPNELVKKRDIDLSGVSVDSAIPKIAMGFDLNAWHVNGRHYIGGHEAVSRVATPGMGEPPDRELNDRLATNIIAAVVGYETSRKIAENIALPFFSTNIVASDGMIKGVLFKVISPSRYADKFFWLFNDGHNEWTEASALYRFGVLYSFCYAEGNPGFGYISESELFSIPARNVFSSTTWAKGVPFVLSSNNVHSAVGDR